MKCIELFTGAGGLALGLHQAGFELTSVIESNPYACATLRSNIRGKTVPGIEAWNLHEEDVRRSDFRSFGHVDLVAGGPPCQPFSIGGKHAGVEDARDMFPEIIRAIRELSPSAFIVENVRGLARPMFADYLSYVRLQLSLPSIVRAAAEGWREHSERLSQSRQPSVDGGGYIVKHAVLNAADYGIAQTRWRLFIVGFRADLNVDWDFPNPTHSKHQLLRDQLLTRDYWSEHGIVPSVERSGDGLPSRIVSRLGATSMYRWRTVRDALLGLPEPAAGDGPGQVPGHRLILGARSYPGHMGSPLDWPAKTLKAGAHGVPGGENMIRYPDGAVRYFTIREAARLQSFPDQWLFAGRRSQLVRQLGNAVPVTLARAVAASVHDALAQARTEAVSTGLRRERHQMVHSPSDQFAPAPQQRCRPAARVKS